MRTLTIVPKAEGKGRTFRGVLLASVEARGWWDGSDVGDALRPALAVVASGPGEAAPLFANLRDGRRASIGDRKDRDFELLKSAPYDVLRQRGVDGEAATFVLPDLFRLDVGFVAADAPVAFIALPTRAWVDVHPVDLAPLQRHAKKLRLLDTTDDGYGRGKGAPLVVTPELAATAALAAAMLDRRSRLPLLPDLRFHVQLLAALLADGHALRSQTNRYRGAYAETDVEAVGFVPGVAVRIAPDALRDVLAAEVARYFAATGGAA